MTYDYTHLPRHAVKRMAVDLVAKARQSRKDCTAAMRAYHRAIERRERLRARLAAIKEALSDG